MAMEPTSSETAPRLSSPPSRLPRLLDEAARLNALCFGNAYFSLDMGLADGDLSEGVVSHARCSLAITAAAAVVPASRALSIGEHTDEIPLGVLGLGEGGIAQLHDEGVVAGASTR
jgi:hypothetical protein